VLHNGVLPAPFAGVAPEAGQCIRAEFGLSREARVLGIVGRIEPGKGIEPLLKAMPAVLAACPDAALLVVGDGPTREASEHLASDLGIADAVRFTGYRSDVPELLAAMDVMAAPSTAEQGLGYAVLEAMCAGVPVVASRCGGPAECIAHGESGLLVPRSDVPALAEALIRLLTDARLRGEVAEGARARSALFSVAQHVDDLKAVYREIFAARVRRAPTTGAAEIRVLTAMSHDDERSPRM
jgi:L-malate glycosyltransferase